MRPLRDVRGVRGSQAADARLYSAYLRQAKSWTPLPLSS
jgi:hypothetical protein